MILDSNLIIYSIQPAYPGLRRLIATLPFEVSAVSKIEVLGYHKITLPEIQQFELFFSTIPVLAVSDIVVDRAIQLRQLKNIELGDAIIAATALVLGHDLYTHNVKDFANIPGLIVIDPIANGDPP